ncbi:hypothetical protein ABPG74_017252 [Tetrahymena malaccensis]
MMTMSQANNNSSSNVSCSNSYFSGVNVFEYELGDIYSAPEIAQNSDLIIAAQQMKTIQQNYNQQHNECSSTDCSSNSDEDLEEFQSIVSIQSAKSIFERIPEKNLALSQSFSQLEAVNNNSDYFTYSLKKYRCLKPSYFNPERESILAKQNSCNEFMEIPSLEKRFSYFFEKVDENYYKIALMNCALKYSFPEELLLHFQKKQSSLNMIKSSSKLVFEEDSGDYLADEEEEDANGLSEEELLQDLYSAPEIL